VAVEKLTSVEVKHWQSRIDIAKQVHQKRQARWRQSLNRYANRNLMSVMGGALDDDHVAVNMLFANIRTKVPALFFHTPDVVAQAQTPDIERESVMVAEATVRKLNEMNDFEGHMDRCVLDSLLFSFGAMKMGYSTRTVNNTESVPREGAQEGIKDKLKKVLPKALRKDAPEETSTISPMPRIISEGPTYLRVSPRNILTHPDATWPLDQGARWMAHRAVYTLRELQFDDRLDQSWRRDLKPTTFLDGERLGLPPQFEPHLVEDPDMMFVVLYEVWDKLRREVITFADGNWDIGAGRIVDWPFHGMEGYPFEFLVPFEIPDEFEALSELDPIIHQLEELDKIRTYQIRHMKRFNRMYVMTDNFDEGVEQDLRRGIDGTVLRTEAETAAGQIEAVPVAQITSDVYGAEGAVKEDIKNISAVSEFDRERVSGSRSATEATIIESANRLRTEFSQKQVSRFGMKCVKKEFQIAQQWMSPDMVVQMAGSVAGSAWRRVTPEMIAGEYQFRFLPGSTAPPNRDLLRAHSAQLYELWNQDPMIDQRELRLMVADHYPELMQGGRADRLIKDPERAGAPPAVDMEQVLQGAAGGGAPGAGVDLAEVAAGMGGGGGGGANPAAALGNVLPLPTR
jgi:hypothetical protein